MTSGGETDGGETGGVERAGVERGGGKSGGEERQVEEKEVEESQVEEKKEVRNVGRNVCMQLCVTVKRSTRLIGFFLSNYKPFCYKSSF